MFLHPLGVMQYFPQSLNNENTSKCYHSHSAEPKCAQTSSLFISLLEPSAPKRWAMCGWGHGVVAGKCLQQCCCCPIFIMSTKAVVSSLWFPPPHFHNLVISVLGNRYHYPLQACVVLPCRAPLCLGSCQPSLREDVCVCTAANPKPWQWNCCLDLGGTLSVHPGLPCRHSWLQVQLYRMPWEGWVLCRALLLVCDSAICHNPEMPPWTESALEMYSFGNKMVEQLFEDASCAS